MRGVRNQADLSIHARTGDIDNLRFDRTGCHAVDEPTLQQYKYQNDRQHDDDGCSKQFAPVRRIMPRQIVELHDGRDIVVVLQNVTAMMNSFQALRPTMIATVSSPGRIIGRIT